MAHLRAAARRSAITRMLEDKGAVSVNDLAAYFQVSPMTIRRDLAALSESGVAARGTGGATLKREGLFELDATQKMRVQAVQKRAIARVCAEQVEEGNSIFIDCGTTPAAIAHELAHRQDLTVFTNSLLVASELSDAQHMQLIMCPGEYRACTMGFLGSTTIEFMKSFRIDLAFMGAEGIDIASGLSVPDSDDCVTKREILNAARKVVFVLDSTKFGQEWLCQICTVDDVDSIVTDDGMSEEGLKPYREAGLEVIAASSNDAELQP